ncbi:MAG: hypothetical protein V5804_15015 [Mucilaginibacter sp.]|uniref:hypothetical protein n=1 Tax=Mucilaginibacter sp. TaxID=1882438 RepID=UPI0034E40A8C
MPVKEALWKLPCVENAAHVYPNAVVINCYTAGFIVAENFERPEQVFVQINYKFA